MSLMKELRKATMTWDAEIKPRLKEVGVPMPKGCQVVAVRAASRPKRGKFELFVFFTAERPFDDATQVFHFYREGDILPPFPGKLVGDFEIGGEYGVMFVYHAGEQRLAPIMEPEATA